MDINQLRNICSDTLKEGKKKHQLAVGIVSCIRDDKYEIFSVDSNTGIPHVGDIFDMRAVYCREVIDKQQTIAITQIDNTPGMCLHPLYETIPCESYISSPIIVNGLTWGTINYTSFEIREAPFTSNDIIFNENKAIHIAASIGKTHF